MFGVQKPATEGLPRRTKPRPRAPGRGTLRGSTARGAPPSGRRSRPAAVAVAARPPRRPAGPRSTPAPSPAPPPASCPPQPNSPPRSSRLGFIGFRVYRATRQPFWDCYTILRPANAADTLSWFCAITEQEAVVLQKMQVRLAVCCTETQTTATAGLCTFTVAHIPLELQLDKLDSPLPAGGGIAPVFV